LREYPRKIFDLGNKHRNTVITPVFPLKGGIMYQDPDVERRHVVVNTPGEYRETVTETQREKGVSGTLIATIAILALLAIGLTYYIVSNKNANEEANRQALLEANRSQPITVTQPAPQQPVIIQQPAQQPPVIIQQPAQSAAPVSNPLDDSTIQDAATKRLTDDPGLASITVMVNSGRATLIGTVNSADLKRSAGDIVRGVQGVKTVDNKIEVSNQ
jgi:hypothetical protein